MAVTSIVHDRIKHHIENTCKGNFETSYLKNLEEVNNIWIFKKKCIQNRFEHKA